MASVSKAQICNLALAHIKQTQTTISNLETDTGNTAAVLRVHYDVARRFVLADHAWNFATKRVTLADIGSPPSGIWTYRYDYPSGCLQLREIQAATRTANPVAFAVEAEDDGSGLSILTDMATAVAIYTNDVENPSLFPPGFVTALGWYLASEIAPALSGSETIQEACLTVYRNHLAAAQAQDAQEGQADDEAASPWEQARLGGATITVNT